MPTKRFALQSFYSSGRQLAPVSYDWVSPQLDHIGKEDFAPTQMEVTFSTPSVGIDGTVPRLGLHTRTCRPSSLRLKYSPSRSFLIVQVPRYDTDSRFEWGSSHLNNDKMSRKIEPQRCPNSHRIREKPMRDEIGIYSRCCTLIGA